MIKLNGTNLDPSYPGGTSFEFDLKNGDRLEVLLKGDTAGIDAIEAVKQGKAVVYRLDGKRIEGTQLPNGVYITNGKKVIVTSDEKNSTHCILFMFGRISLRSVEA